MTTFPAMTREEGSNVPEWTLGDRLRKIRRDQHMTQEQIGLELGIKPVTWAAWEAGRNRPDDVVALAVLIEQRYGVPAGWTLGVLNQSIPQQGRRIFPNQPRAGGRRFTDRFPATLTAVL